MVRFGIFQKSASGLVPDGWVELRNFSNRYHFRTFQLELDNVGTKKFKIGSVVKKLQPYSEVVYKIFYLGGCNEIAKKYRYLK